MSDEIQLDRVVQNWKSKPVRAKRLSRIVVLGSEKAPASPPAALGSGIAEWAWREVKESKKPVERVIHKSGEGWLVRPGLWGSDQKLEGSLDWLSYTPYAQARDAVGQAVIQALDEKADGIELEFSKCSDEVIHGGLVGVELAGYDFRRFEAGNFPPKMGLKIQVDGKPLSPGRTAASYALSSAVNLARHMTNLPPNILHPENCAQAVKKLFKSGCEVIIWGPDRLKREKMNLMLAVGMGSVNPPRLVHIRYRPSGAKGKKPIAFVGKGITFDTGGLNLKPDSGMRLMKKDMGGAAAVAGLAWWVVQSKLKVPCDFYLALAENSVSGSSYRPGDIFRSRSGTSVEIHNTDAEGRLVLADAMDVALDARPEVLVDVATLTGAIKAGLGSHVAGLFGNRNDIILEVAKSAQQMGDWVWPMPLYRKYKSALKSSVAEMVNAGDGFGGAITAALFLENFVGETPWVHLDIYAWKDSADGAIGATGASGQAVQALATWLESRA